MLALALQCHYSCYLPVVLMPTYQVAQACASDYNFLRPRGSFSQRRLVKSTYNIAFEYVIGNQIVAVKGPRHTPGDPIMAISMITGPTNGTCVNFRAGYLLNQTSPLARTM